MEEAVAALIDDDRVASAVRKLMAPRTEWTGTATELLKILADEVGDQIAKSKDWPQNPRAMSGCVRRLAPALRRVGIDVTFPRGKDKKRTRTIIIAALSKQELEPSQPTAVVTAAVSVKFASAPSASSASAPSANNKNGLDAAAERTVEWTVADLADGRDDRLDDTVRDTVRRNPLNSNDATVSDGADAENPPSPKPTKRNNPGWSVRL